MSSQKDSVELRIDGYISDDKGSARMGVLTLTKQFMETIGKGDYEVSRIIVQPIGETNYQGVVHVNISCSDAERKRLAKIAEQQCLYQLLEQLDVKKRDGGLRDLVN